MKKNEECDIVKDLAIPYKEDMINPKSKEFIENHLQICDNCKKYYDSINSDIFDEIQKEKIDEQKEVDFMKKTRNYIKIIKSILAVILLIIIVIGSFFAIKYQVITYIVNKSYKKMEELKTLDNYKLIEEEIYIDNSKEQSIETLTTTYYHKDEKNKKIYDNAIVYYEDNSYYSTIIFNDLKQIDYNRKDYFKYTKGRIFERPFLEIINSKNMPIYMMFYTVRKDKYDGIECYVFRRGNKNSYFNVWIDKTTYNVLRTVEVSYNNYYREIKWYLYENETTDEDVDASVLETELYNDYEKNYNEKGIN